MASGRLKRDTTSLEVESSSGLAIGHRADALRCSASLVRCVLACAAALATAGGPAHAQVPKLVLDISPAPGAPSDPSGFTFYSGRTYFSAARPDVGAELWRSDGTPAGTTLVVDLHAGPFSAVPMDLEVANGLLFFSANTLATGRELFRSDGTDTGTVLVLDIEPSASSSDPLALAVHQDTLYFSAWDAVFGRELWRSDGTVAGTQRVLDLEPGPLDSGPIFLTEFNGFLYFSAETAQTGRELWRTNGTAAGTQIVRDIHLGAAGSLPSNLIVAGSQLFFTANDGVNGYELWRTDGTSSGTQLVLDIAPGPLHSISATRAVVGDVLYFAATAPGFGSELWRSDGTAAGTALVADVRPGPIGSYLASIGAVGERVLFVADDGTSGFELWASDGTAAGTARIADVWPGPDSGFVDDPFFADVDPIAVVNDRALFRANDGANGFELWQSDGTVAGTARVSDLRPGPAGSDPRVLRKSGNAVWFRANDGLTGNEPWVIAGPVGEPYCFGDGSDSGATACPCANPGAAGRGCANSFTTGALLFATGSTEPDQVLLDASELLPSALAIFLQGSASHPTGVVFGDGVRCVAGLLKKIAVVSASDGAAVYPHAGEPSISSVSAALGDPIAAGETRYYQVYYRDPVEGFCPSPAGSTWNISNAVRIDW